MKSNKVELLRMVGIDFIACGVLWLGIVGKKMPELLLKVFDFLSTHL